jgi:hypothetical protein
MCREQVKQATRIAEKYPGGVKLEKFDAISDEADKYGIMSCPSLVINDKVVSTGRIFSAGDIEKRIQKEIETK